MNFSKKVASSAALLFVTSGAMAAITVTETTFTLVAEPNMFVQTDFAYQLSAGVLAAGAENNVKFVASARHAKGRFTYGADSEGGSVRACETAPVAAGFTTASTPDLTPLDPTAPAGTPTGACAGT